MKNSVMQDDLGNCIAISIHEFVEVKGYKITK